MPKPRGRVFDINSSCTSCGACIQVCPTESIFIGKSQYLIDADTCDGSAVCAKVCPVDAIHPKINSKVQYQAEGTGS